MPIRRLKGGQEAEKQENSFYRLMLVGPTGTGKTTQFLTLPGVKFVYSFDPNSAKNLQRWLTPDDTILEFMPDIDELDVWPKSIEEKVAGEVALDPKLYKAFLRDLEYRCIPEKEGQKSEFQELGEKGGWVIVDSLTFVQAACMDAVLVMQAEAGSKDIRNDAQVVGQRMGNVARIFGAMPCNLAVSAHYRVWKNDDGTRETQLEVYGKARISIPGGFNDIFSTNVSVPMERNKIVRNGKATFTVQTVPSDDAPSCRSSLAPGELHVVEDVTLDFTKGLVGQGIGKWFPTDAKEKASQKKAA